MTGTTYRLCVLLLLKMRVVILVRVTEFIDFAIDSSSDADNSHTRSKMFPPFARDTPRASEHQLGEILRE